MVVNKSLREGAGVRAGDIVAVEMERDEELRTVEPPVLLKKELAKSKAAQANWEKQSFSNRKEMARSIEQVKREEIRARRLAKVMRVLKYGKEWTG